MNSAVQKIITSRRDFFKLGLSGIAGVAGFPLIHKEGRNDNTDNTLDKKKFVYRILGKTGLKLPVISMGAVNTDNPSLILAALDAGIIYFDTGYWYQRGKNEEMLGKIFKHRSRDSFIISSKLQGEHENHIAGTFNSRFDPKSFRNKFEISLKRLQMEYVDIFLLHNAGSREVALFDPLLSVMSQFKKEGKARFLGVSTHVNEPEVIRAAADSRVYDVVMTAYNFRQPHLKEMNESIDGAAKAGLGIIAMKTQAGVYWDKERKHPINMKAALKWAVQNENIHTAIPGITTFDQLKTDLSVMVDLQLKPEEAADLRKAPKLSISGLYCAQCCRCRQQCLYHHDIPTFMRSYMYAYGYKNFTQAKAILKGIRPDEIMCGVCEACSVSCPMDFNIREKVKDIIRILHIPDEFLG